MLSTWVRLMFACWLGSNMSVFTLTRSPLKVYHHAGHGVAVSHFYNHGYELLVDLFAGVNYLIQ